MPHKDPARAAEYHRQYRDKNRARIYANIKAFHAANPGKNQEYSRRSKLKAKYGLSEADIQRMLAEQGEKCPICHGTEPGPHGWVVDHCHGSGRVRAMLCDLCNSGLGFFKDKPDVMERAAEYLRAHKAGEGS
jgi:hypothetical protein